MEKRIHEALEKIEWEHGVDILYACESGSRAWGFTSPNSDYDVRFLYVHPETRCLSIGQHRDVIEEPIVDELDVNGWDLRKALLLMRKSNPSLLEWLHSPIVYRADEGFLHKVRHLALKSLDRRALMHHYSSMARHDWRKIQSAEVVPLKRYFYVLRTAMCAYWVADISRTSMPPILFMDLVNGIKMSEQVNACIEELLKLKAQAAEKTEVPRLPEIEGFVEGLLAELDVVQLERAKVMEPAPFDQLFLETLRAG
ncbi:nucleotidyltransferase domain-containing protein [Hahella ganghwensis]|uniref:nucleotidyltransferase domain-containing protein n=1 Tax=Hahella ganghwensis TaxID=286420 RepID=UPI000361E09D|nr:nucleotidyltransferase domain-containing protein [Hahella ganghwensis]